MHAAHALLDSTNTSAPRVKIIHADAILRDAIRPEIQRLMGDVVLQYQDKTLRCDSAWRFDDGHFQAMGNVRMEGADGSLMRSESLELIPEKKLIRARSFDDLVVLQEGNSRVRTPRLTYALEEDRVYFPDGGELEQDSMTAVFARGLFDVAVSVLQLGGDVRLQTSSDRVLSDSLHINRVLRTFEFFGKSEVHSEDGHLELRCERGMYREETESGWFAGQFGPTSLGFASLRYGGDWLRADSLVLPENSADPEEAWGRVMISDTSQTWKIWGAKASQYVRSDSLQEAWVVGDSLSRALLMESGSSDTLWLRADTLRLESQVIRAWPKMELHQGSAFAACDTLVWLQADSIMEFRQAPRLWFDGQLLRADSVRLGFRGQSPHHLDAKGHASLMRPVGDTCYQQIVGRTMEGAFQNDALESLLVSGNAALIYFDEAVEAVCSEYNRAACSRMRILLADGEVEKMVLLEEPSGTWSSLDSGSKDNNALLNDLIWEEELDARSWAEMRD